MINLNALSREIRDFLELRSESEPTFERALEEDYTETFFETLEDSFILLSRASSVCSLSKSYTTRCFP